MEVKFSNSSILEETQEKDIQRFIKEKARKFDKYVKDYPKNLVIEVHFSKIKHKRISISFILRMKEEVIYVKGTGEDMFKIVNELLTKLKNALIKQLHKEKKDYLYKRKNRKIKSVKDYSAQLEAINEEEDFSAFSKLLTELLPNLRNYVRRRIHVAELTNAINKGEFNEYDIIDELYMKIYEEFRERPKDKGLNTWIYQRCDEIIEQKIQEETYQKNNIENLDSIVEKEYDAMLERYGTNAEGKCAPYDELEGMNQSSTLQFYQADEILTGLEYDEELDQIYASLNKEEIDHLIHKELAKLPAQKRDVLDLYVIEQMNEEEISLIKRISVSDVKNHIEEGMAHLRNKIVAIM